MTITFNNTYGAGITGQSAAFQTTFTNLVTGVEAFFSQQFSDTVTLNVTFDWQPLNPGYVSGGFTLGSNNFALHEASYADIRNALIGHTSTNDSNPGDDAATIAALPATDPAPTTGSNTARYLVTNGQEKLLGLNGVGANDNLGADATITLASDLPNSTFFDFDRSDGIGTNGFDAFGVMAHEISEGLFGRIMSGGGVPKNGTTNDYNIMDLFHYTAAGARAMLETGGNNLLSFSGTTGDPNLNRVLDNSGDISDPSSGADPRSSFADGNTGVIQEITQTGLRTLDALGWARVNGLDDHNQSNTGATTALNAGAANGINGNLELQGDHDWFKVTLDGSKNYAIVTEGSATGGGRTLADPFVALYGGVNPSRDTTLPLQTANDGGVGANSLLLTPFGASGDFFADVGSILNNVQDINKGTYRVSLIEDDFRQDTDTTGSVATGSSSTGNIQFAKDHDWFKINLTTGENYAIIVKGNTGGLPDPQIQLRSPAGSSLAAIHNNPANDNADFGSGPTLNSRILWSRGIDDTLGPIPATDGYFLDVSAPNGTDLGDYTVNVVKDDFRGDQFGNNGSVVIDGAASAGNIEFETDHDWFKIALTAGENYAIIVKGNTGGLADPQIKLMDPSGTSLATIHNSSTNDNADFGSGPTLNSRILWSRGIDDALNAPATDTYFLDVSSQIGNATGAYSVSVIKDDFRGDQFGNNGALTVGSLAGSSGKIEFQTDHDWFSAHLDAGTSYALRVRGTDSSSGTLPNPDIDLKTAGGVSVAGGTLLHDITAANHDARLLIAPAATGDYFVDASSQVGTDTGSYNAQALLASQLARPNDFNGDGTSDIFWRAPAGSNLFWEIQNFAHTATDPLPQQAFNWKVAETGDFDGDLTTDILWSSGTGQLLEWHIVNGAISGAPIDLGFKSPTLTVRGSGDFYKDGRSSILFRSSDGEVLTWETNPNGTFKTAMDSHGFVSRSNHIVGTGDFNGDGRAEILWRGDGGNLLKSDAVGSSLTLTSLGNLSSSWHVVGTGDFFGDGKQEAVLSNAGQYKLADLNGGPLLGTTFTTQSTNWKLADIGDYNGDGKYDLLFNSTTGANKFVEANGAEHTIDLIGVSWAAQHHNYEYV